MLEMIFLFALALIWILFALIQDLKTTEIANWLSFSLIIFALSFRFFYSLFLENFNFFYQGFIGLAIFCFLGYLFYYAKMFAGGDAKLFFSFGAVFPLNQGLILNVKGFLFFLFLFFIAGAVYSIIASLFLCIKNYSKFKKEFRKQLKERKRLINLLSFLAVILGIIGFIFYVFLFYLAIVIFILQYFYLYAKAVDEAAMIKNIETAKLREGDWLYKDIKIKGKIIKATWDGLSKQEIKFLKRYKKKVWIREGVPFTGAFLISFVVYSYFLIIGLGNSFW